MNADQRVNSGKCRPRTNSTGSSSLVPGQRPKGAGTLVQRPVQGLGGIDYGALRALVPISSVLHLLEFQPVERIGDQLRGPCPVHRSSSPTGRSFSVNLRKNAFQCFGGRCGTKGSQLDLWAAAQELPLYEASILLAERLGIEVPRLRDNA